MPRGINATFQNQLDAGVCNFAYLVDLNFSGSRLRLTNAPRDVSVYAVGTFTSVGSLLQISSVNETTDLGMSGISMSLSGCDSQIVTLARDTEIQGTPVVVYLAVLHETTNDVMYKHLYFKGVIDNMTYIQSADQIIVDTACENFLVRFDERKNRRYTDQDQRLKYPNDDGLMFVEDIAEQELVWGV